MPRPSRVVPLITLAAIAGSASAAMPEVQALRRQARAELLAAHPGLIVKEAAGRVSLVAGKPMTMGVTARGASDAWLAAHGAVLSVDGTALTPKIESAAADGKFTVLSYQQSVDGVPVEHGTVQVTVLNEPFPRVVMVTSGAAPRPEQVPAAKVTPEMALAIVRAQPLYRALTRFGQPEMVLLQDESQETLALRPVWKVSGTTDNIADAKEYTFFVNTQTGRVEHVRSEIYTLGSPTRDTGGSVVDGAAIAGVIRGNATPGTLPDTATNPPVPTGLPDLRYSVGGTAGITNRDGSYSATPVGPGPFTLTSSTQATGGAGRWVNVVPNDGTASVTGSLSGLSAPTSGADLLLNASPSERITAQINTFLHTTITHNFLKDRLPSFNQISIAIPANTGVSGSCNAFFSGTAITINFYNSGGGCVNTAYAPVIAHEYGHFVVNRRGLAQGNFGEGYGDSLAMMIYDDSVVGRGFQGPGTFVRDPVNSTVTVGCTGGSSVHFCGQVLGKSWWRVRQELGNSLGSAQGLARARDIFAAWTLSTGGWGPSGSAASAQALNLPTEILVLDDNDGDITNGTPNRAAICQALSAAGNGPGYTCPALNLVTASFPSGRPTVVAPNVATSFPVIAASGAATPVPGTGVLNYRFGSAGAFTQVPLAQGATNQYTVSLPATQCLSSIEYFLTFQSSAGEQRIPDSGQYSAVAGALAANLNFNADPGWTVTNTGGLTTGAWQRGVPANPNADPAPLTDFDGSGQCWVTDNRGATTSGQFDIDPLNARTQLTSGVYDLSNVSGARVEYALWFSGSTGDEARVEASSDNGVTWTTIDLDTTSALAWQQRSVPLTVAPTSQVRFRFSAADLNTATVIEAGLDAFRLITCPSTPPPCYANCDGSTSVPALNALDFSCFLGRYQAGDAYANCDGSTNTPSLNALDFSCFLQRYQQGCN